MNDEKLFEISSSRLEDLVNDLACVFALLYALRLSATSTPSLISHASLVRLGFHDG